MHEEDICSLPKHSPVLRVQKAPHIEIEVLNERQCFFQANGSQAISALHTGVSLLRRALREPPTFSKSKDDAPCILIK
jgi:hypothetical protein